MAYSYRASSSAGNASGGALSINKPTGTADGDLLVAVLYLESDTNTFSSVPSGWTLAGSQVNTGGFKVWIYWKWAASEGASWSWTPTTNNWRTWTVAAYSGGSGSGTPTTAAVGSSQADAVIASAQTAPTITTTAANSLLIFGYGNFSGTNPTGVSGAVTTLRIAFGGVAIADANIATASATGTSAPTGTGTEDYAAIHQEFLLSPGGAAASLPPRKFNRSMSGLIVR